MFMEVTEMVLERIAWIFDKQSGGLITSILVGDLSRFKSNESQSETDNVYEQWAWTLYQPSLSIKKSNTSLSNNYRVAIYFWHCKVSLAYLYPKFPNKNLSVNKY